MKIVPIQELMRRIADADAAAKALNPKWSVQLVDSEEEVATARNVDVSRLSDHLPTVQIAPGTARIMAGSSHLAATFIKALSGKSAVEKIAAVLKRYPAGISKEDLWKALGGEEGSSMTRMTFDSYLSKRKDLFTAKERGVYVITPTKSDSPDKDMSNY